MSENGFKGETEMPEAYRRLLEKLVAWYGSVQPEKEDPYDVNSYWEMGKFIVAAEQDGEVKATYGQHVLTNLAKDLKRHAAKNSSERSLQFMRKFYAQYDAPSPGTELSWSHYKLLLTVANKKRRTAIQKRVVTERLSKSALAQLTQLANSHQKYSTAGAGKLSPRYGEYDVCKVMLRTGAVGNPNQIRILLDVGFHQNIEVPISVDFELVDGQYVKCVPLKNKMKLLPSNCKRGERYCFRAALLEVVDGDTIVAEIQLPNNNSRDVRLRLRGFDAPELTLKEGQSAKRHLEALFPPNASLPQSLTVITYGTDIYGRYVADVFVETDAQREMPPFAPAGFVNQQMLASKLVIPMHKNK